MIEGIQKPNCTTCTKCPFLLGTYFDDRLNNPVYEIVKHTGCFYHPDARKYLNNDVIAEYESRLKEGEVVVGLKPAISHLREGVKK